MLKFQNIYIWHIPTLCSEVRMLLKKNTGFFNLMITNISLRICLEQTFIKKMTHSLCCQNENLGKLNQPVLINLPDGKQKHSNTTVIRDNFA